jgi:hypothetical protein
MTTNLQQSVTNGAAKRVSSVNVTRPLHSLTPLPPFPPPRILSTVAGAKAMHTRGAA